jgi:hypothetical protein
VTPDAPLDGVRAHVDALGDVAVALRSSAPSMGFVHVACFPRDGRMPASEVRRS